MDRSGTAQTAQTTCPECGHGEWKSARLVYDERRGPNGAELSDLAKKAAPPQPPKPVKVPRKISPASVFSWLIWGLTGAAALSGVRDGIVPAAVVAFSLGVFGQADSRRRSKPEIEAGERAQREAETRFLREVADYERRRMCVRCGAFYTPKAE